MKKQLIDVIFNSKKRKETLLMLQDGSQEMDYLLKSLDTTRQALLPQLKILEDHHLVFHHYDIYELTTIGKLIVDEMKPLIDTTEVLDIDIDYWGTRNFSFIPPHLLKRINELGTCEIITPPISETHEVLQKFHSASKNSISLCGITTFFSSKFL